MPEATAYVCDVTNEPAWRDTLAKICANHGEPNVVVINTEGGAWGDYANMSVDRFRGSFDVNVVAVLVLMQELFSNPDAKMLECQRCKHHYCIKCLNKSDLEYEILSTSDSMWFCGPCKAKVEENIATELKIEEKCNTQEVCQIKIPTTF